MKWIKTTGISLITAASLLLSQNTLAASSLELQLVPQSKEQSNKIPGGESGGGGDLNTPNIIDSNLVDLLSVIENGEDYSQLRSFSHKYFYNSISLYDLQSSEKEKELFAFLIKNQQKVIKKIWNVKIKVQTEACQHQGISKAAAAMKDPEYICISETELEKEIKNNKIQVYSNSLAPHNNLILQSISALFIHEVIHLVSRFDEATISEYQDFLVENVSFDLSTENIFDEVNKQRDSYRHLLTIIAHSIKGNNSVELLTLCSGILLPFTANYTIGEINLSYLASLIGTRNMRLALTICKFPDIKGELNKFFNLYKNSDYISVKNDLYPFRHINVSANEKALFAYAINYPDVKDQISLTSNLHDSKVLIKELRLIQQNIIDYLNYLNSLGIPEQKD